jgi:hypothetical protein
LTSVIVQDCDLTGLDFTDATLQNVCFLNCPTLHLARGLENIQHKPSRSWQSPSSLDMTTVRASIRNLPDVFLRGMGISDEEVTAWGGVSSQSRDGGPIGASNGNLKASDL